ncbi:MAG: rhomboid family intrarane serine protease [Nocardioidaceae bacterium]|nr:rhomboid family intrarane serine protease [Nocardioidaceae bacterium]
MTFWVAVYGALTAGFMLAEHRMPVASLGRVLRPWPVLTTTAVLVIGTVSTLQLTVLPALLGHLRRDTAAVRAGEWWRLGTALVTQDGGWFGFVTNMVTLVLVGVVAEFLLGRRAWLLAFGVPALAAEVVALWWQPTGAGNSVAVAGLCGAVAVAALARAPYAVPAIVSILAWAVLAVQGDIHGAAGVVGVLVGLALRTPWLARAASPRSPGSRGTRRSDDPAASGPR